MKDNFIGLEIRSSTENIYYNFIKVINFQIKDENRKYHPLTEREIEVLSLLMKLNIDFNSLPEEQRYEYLLSPYNRKIIRDEVDMQSNHLNNILSKLKTMTFLNCNLMSTKFWDLGLTMTKATKDKPAGIKIEIYDTGTRGSDKQTSEETQSVQDSSDAITEQDGEVYQGDNGETISTEE